MRSQAMAQPSRAPPPATLRHRSSARTGAAGRVASAVMHPRPPASTRHGHQPPLRPPSQLRPPSRVASSFALARRRARQQRRVTLPPPMAADSVIRASPPRRRPYNLPHFPSATARAPTLWAGRPRPLYAPPTRPYPPLIGPPVGRPFGWRPTSPSPTRLHPLSETLHHLPPDSIPSPRHTTSRPTSSSTTTTPAKLHRWSRSHPPPNPPEPSSTHHLHPTHRCTSPPSPHFLDTSGRHQPVFPALVTTPTTPATNTTVPPTASSFAHCPPPLASDLGDHRVLIPPMSSSSRPAPPLPVPDVTTANNVKPPPPFTSDARTNLRAPYRRYYWMTISDHLRPPHRLLILDARLPRRLHRHPPSTTMPPPMTTEHHPLPSINDAPPPRRHRHPPPLLDAGWAGPDPTRPTTNLDPMDLMDPTRSESYKRVAKAIEKRELEGGEKLYP